ncbi:MAG: primosomal protein N', partial [Alphaproteobacteria bacterium]
MIERARVLLPLPLTGAFDYRVPSGFGPLEPGTLVRVPFGRRELTGVVWDGGSDLSSARIDDAKLKTVAARAEAPPLPANLVRFIDWVSSYTLAPAGAVLKMAISVPQALGPARPIQGVAASGRTIEGRITAARARVLAVLANGPPRPLIDLARDAAVTPGVVRAMLAAGFLQGVPLPAMRPGFPEPDGHRAGQPLSGAQSEAAAGLCQQVAGAGSAMGFSVTLLDGVTGAGKTEVYFEAIAAALRAGRQTLVLLPEIALGPQWLDRFARRFGVRPAAWHSDLGEPERRRVWRAVADGTAKVVVGARSALFLPFPALGLIIVDEEHDAAYKQEDGVIYHARDMAVVRGRIERVPVVLVSATPSLETVVNCERGRYRRLHLPDRHAGARLPDVRCIDLRTAPPPRGRWLAPPLGDAITETLEAGEQALLFLNRRGYAPLTLCRACGHRLQCHHCTAWLVEHRGRNRLECHHCGHVAHVPKTCPSCSAEDSFVACGPGVERVAEEVAALFPAARLAVMSSDTLGGPRAAESLLDRFQRHEIDIIIGTQVVAKGHHFPKLTLVGVVDADLGLTGGDPRAAERTYQILHQVAGRAGRADLAGRVLLQTYMPEHAVMRALVSG